MPIFILFDIDGTLISLDGAGSRSLNRAMVHLRTEVSTGKGHVKIGVRELLQALEDLEGIHLGLLTGNAETGARVKLEPFGLNHYFPVGAFGSDSEDRNLLLPIAVHRLHDSKSVTVKYESCVVVGDTPKDVECALIHGASSIAVATGPYPLSELAVTEAGLVVADLSDTKQIVEWITDFSISSSRQA